MTEIKEEIKNDLESFSPHLWEVEEITKDGVLFKYTCSPSEYIVQIFLKYDNYKIYFTFGREDNVEDFCGDHHAVVGTANYSCNIEEVIHKLKEAVEDYIFEDEGEE